MAPCSALACAWASGAASLALAAPSAVALPASPVPAVVDAVVDAVGAGLHGHGTRSSATSCARSVTTPCRVVSASARSGAQ